MQTIAFHTTIGDDGVLRLELPFGARGQLIEGVVVLQTQNGNANGAARPSLSLAELAGSIDDETFVEPDELPFETREPIK